MKNLGTKLLILGIVSLSVVFIGCKKDAVDNNKFTFESKDYSIRTGYLTYHGPMIHDPITYKFDLKVISAGITYNSSTNSLTGKGNFIGLTMYSLDPDFLSSGLYTFDGFSSKDSLTFNHGVVGVNYNFDSGTDTTKYSIKTGVIQVESSGNFYILDFNFYTNSNKQIKGSFSALLQTSTALAIKKKSEY
ncbi:MAG: hypothetical protein HOO91_10795 [Bacteroidales bacterium]|nr:hypothetical protein [Bacteroidales bacterium]